MSETWKLAASPQYGWHEGLLALRETVEEDGRPDAEIAADLNSRTIPIAVPVPTDKVLSVLLLTGDWGKIVLASQRPPTGDERDALTIAAINCVWAVERMKVFGSDQSEDLGVIEQMMTAFVGAEILSLATSMRLSEMMVAHDRVWFPDVTEADVKQARTLVDG